jgi:hypothetical protein
MMPKVVYAADGTAIALVTKPGYLGGGVKRAHGGYTKNKVTLSRMTTPMSRKRIAFHELLHDGLDRAGVKNSPEVERVLDGLDDWTFELLRGNPELRTWLFEDDT